MCFVRIRNQDQWIPALQGLEKILRNERFRHEHRGPGCAELRKCHVQRSPLTKVIVKILRRNLTTLVQAHQDLVPEDRFELRPGNRARFVKRFYYRIKAEIDENFTEVEQEGLNLHS